MVITSLVLTRKAQRQRETFGIPILPGDIIWSLDKTLSTQLMAIVVGTIAGLLGLGGGELMAPLLVHLGMLPEVTSAVNAFIIFFTAAADLEHYSDLGGRPHRHTVTMATALEHRATHLAAQLSCAHPLYDARPPGDDFASLSSPCP